MNHYRVIWEIDAEAETPRAAAEWALRIMQAPKDEPDSAVVFDVYADDGTMTHVDLGVPV